jgi:hypothetical protein
MTICWESEVLKEDQLDNASLHHIFCCCVRVFKHLSDLPRNADEAQAILARSLNMLQRCDAVIDAAGVFSDNEDKDDIPTSSLRCGARLCCIPVTRTTAFATLSVRRT